MEVKKIKQKTKIPKKIRVCAYARVSLEKESMLHSLSYQVSYYSNLIQNNNKWLYAGVFSDEGVTGTKANRPGFQKMMEECGKGNIDLILVKSVSRFARNTVDLLNACRELKELNIDVYFEEERIHTLSYEGELLLTLRASFAQEESRSMSENIKWKIRKDMQEGLPQRNRALGYDIKERKVTIIPEEANIVKLIFKWYLDGQGTLLIARKLNEMGYKNVTGKPFSPVKVSHILKNTNYTGNLLLQKTFRKNHLCKCKSKNNGELPQYLVENNHPAIISVEDFEKVQALLNSKNDKYHLTNGGRFPFSGMITCSCCGYSFHRRKVNGKTSYMCVNKINKNVVKCESQQIPEYELYRMANEVLSIKEFNADYFKDQIEKIVALTNQEVEFHFKNGDKVIKQWRFRSRKESWTPEMKERAKSSGLAGANKRYKKGE